MIIDGDSHFLKRVCLLYASKGSAILSLLETLRLGHGIHLFHLSSLENSENINSPSKQLIKIVSEEALISSFLISSQ
jgi:hypothetical protein